MKANYFSFFISGLLVFFISCNENLPTQKAENISIERKSPNVRQVDRFADVQILRYEIKDFDKLSLSQKQLVYFLSQAGLSGRDIIYDQNNAYNLQIRRCFEGVIKEFKGDKDSDQWYLFMTYAKQVWFANGIHHHYGMEKFSPKFSQEYFASLLESTGVTISLDAIATIFNEEIDSKRKVKDPNVDMIVASANNFYGEGITLSMVEDFYKAKIDTLDTKPIEYGLNSTLMMVNDTIKEDVWKSGGKYGKAIDKIIYNLEMASKFAENQDQKAAIEKLIEYYQTGDLRIWDEYSILWAKSTNGDIDWINGFIETYGDAIGKRASYESIVQITDFEASKQMQVVTQNAQWFEDNSPLIESHKKKNVKGVSYKVVQVASESGDASPSTPIGVNLPNNNWIRENHGSKSVSLGNIIAAMVIVTCYTLVNHMFNSFSEEAGHWVMWPFFKDHTSYGAILALVIPINIWLLYESKKNYFRILLIVFLVILIIGLYFSYTRAAWLSIVLAMGVFFLYYFKIKFKWLIAIIIIPSIFILYNLTEISYFVQKNDAEHTTENFSERIESMSNISSDASNLERLNRWNCAIKLFTERPFFGWGPGTFAFVYAPFQKSKDLTIISTNFGDGGNAHSEYLSPLAEQGVFGFIINIFLIGFVFVYTGIFYIKCEDDFYKILTLFIILSLTTYFTHGVLNNYLDTDKAAIPIWGLIGIFITIKTYLSPISKNTTY